MSVIVETGEEARKRRETEAMASTVGNTLLAPLEAWFLMLLMGGLHSTWADVPAIGYGTAFLIVLSVLLTAHMTAKFRSAK